MARLRVGPEDAPRQASQLSRIVDYIDQLRDFPAAAAPVEIVAGGSEREDRPAPSMDRALFLANAPEALDGFLVVPKVRGDGG